MNEEIGKTPEINPEDNFEQENGETTNEKESQPEDIISIIRDREFLSALVDGRDVSMVYIHREVKNFYGDEPQYISPQLKPMSGKSPKLQRIKDLVLNPLPFWEIERSAAVYVPMKNHNEALERLRQNKGILILYGKTGTGKRTTAIRLLIQLLEHLPDINLYELNPSIRLKDIISNQEFPPNSGIILESPSGEALEGLQDFHLNALCSKIQESSNKALIITTSHVTPSFPMSYRHLILPWKLEWPGDILKSQLEVLNKHLRYFVYTKADRHIDNISSYTEMINNLPDIQNILKRQITPAEIASLAEALLPTLTGQYSIEEALARFGSHAYKEVEQWFAEGHAPEDEALLIATAVFHRAPYVVVNDISQDLLRRLQPTEHRESEGKELRDSTSGSLFASARHRRQRLTSIRAHTEKDKWHGHFGEVEEEVIVFDNPAWQEAVVRLLWEFDAYREVILQWLMDYGAHSWHALRTRAAAAIGAWAQEDFSFIETRVLREWARSPNPDVRRSAAQVLGITIWDERRSGTTSRLLHYWATQKDEPRWQWTATMAYAGLAGPRFPQQTLSDLGSVAGQTVEHPFLLEPFLRALLNFYAAATTLPDRRLSLLESLKEWSEDGETRKQRAQRFPLRRAALLGFWTMLWPERDDPVWQLLLADASRPGPAQNIAITLMRRSLNFRQPKHKVADKIHPRKIAIEGLHALLRYIGNKGEKEQQDQLISVLNALRRHISQYPDEIQRLEYYVSSWTDLEGTALHLAKHLI